MGTKINTFSIGDANIESLMLSTDELFVGFHKVSLTNFDTTDEPQVAAGSLIECAGALYKFSSNESITDSGVSDGIVYIQVVPGTTTCTLQYTNTAPTWSDAYQGWYGTGAEVTCRYLEFVLIKISSDWYKDKCSPDDYIFLAFAPGTQISPGSSTNINFNNVIYDKYSIYNDSTYEINPPLINSVLFIRTSISHSNAVADPVVINVGSGSVIYSKFKDTSNYRSTASDIFQSSSFQYSSTLLKWSVKLQNGTTVGTIESTSFIVIKKISTLCI